MAEYIEREHAEWAQKGAKANVFNSSVARKRRTKPMKTVTYEEFLEFKPCWLKYEDGAERIKAYFDRFGGKMSALDVLNLDDVSEVDKLWSVLREEFIPAPILHEFACVCTEYALSLIDNPDPRSIKAIEVKRAWIRGEATNEELETARYAADCCFGCC